MRIILSRKGFDSGSGGCASPIFPDGTMLSLPIPIEEDSTVTTRFQDILFGKNTYQDIWDQLSPRHSGKGAKCHLDPDIRSDIRNVHLHDWCPAFGQIDAAETHLRNNGVQTGDLFLFFGWFRNVKADHQGMWRFDIVAPDIHAIYGYLQIGRIVRGDGIKEFSWHPHASSEYLDSPTNTLYIASDRLMIDGLDYDLPGSGVMKFDKRLVLTKLGMKRSCWHLLDWMNSAVISYHSPDRVHKDEMYFQSAARGQEFVIEENPEVTKWALSLLLLGK